MDCLGPLFVEFWRQRTAAAAAAAARRHDRQIDMEEESQLNRNTVLVQASV